MAKNWIPTAKGRRTIKPDLYEGLRAFARQQKDIVAAAKEEDLRIQQRNEQWDKSQKGTESNVLENRKLLQEAENEKFRTRAIAITNRRDTEVDRLRGEAKIAEKRASDWQALTPKLAKSITDVGTTTSKLADYHFGHKEYKKKGGLNDIIYTTSALANDQGIASLEAATLKLEAYRKGDYEALKWTGDRLDYSLPKSQALFTRDFKKNFDSGVAFRKAEIVKSGIRYDDTTIEDIWGLMTQEVLDRSGIDINSKEGQEIARLFENHAYKEKLEYVNVRDESQRKKQHEDNLDWIEENHKGQAGKEIFHNAIVDQMKQNFRYNPRTGLYELKATGEHFTLKDAWSKVIIDLSKKDWIQEKGFEYLDKNFIQQELPRENYVSSRKALPVEYGHIKFPEMREVFLKSFNNQAALKRANREGLLKKSEEDFMEEIDRLTNPEATLREGEVFLDRTDTERGGGFDMIASKCTFAPTEKAKTHCYSKLDYTLSKSNGYSLALHKAIVEAGESGDPAGYVYLVDQIADPTIKKEKQAKYKFATVLLRGGRSFESMNDWSESEVLKKLGGSPTIPGTNKFKKNYKDQTADLNQYLHWYISENIDRLDAPKSEEGFDGNVESFFNSMEKDVSEEFQADDSKRFPTIPAGGEDSVKGQKGLLFSRMLSGGNVEESPTTMTDYKAVLDKHWIDNSSPLGFYKGNPNQVIGDKIPNIDAVIKSGVLFTPTERLNLVTSIEEGGGMDNVIYIKPDIYELADMHPEWTARDIVNADLKEQGFKHRLPPDPYTFVKMSGYKGKKPKNRNVNSILYRQNILNEIEEDPFKRKYLHEKPKDVASINQSTHSYVNGQIISNIL